MFGCFLVCANAPGMLRDSDDNETSAVVIAAFHTGIDMRLCIITLRPEQILTIGEKIYEQPSALKNRILMGLGFTDFAASTLCHNEIKYSKGATSMRPKAQASSTTLS